MYARSRIPVSHAPLTPIDFHVLLVLAGEPLYGYAILQAVERESDGAVAPEIGSLYRVLARLLDSGLVEETEAPEGAPTTHRGRPRRYYAITDQGRVVLITETERLSGALKIARTRLRTRPAG
jgi:DNA-binding PadR family transcriptional regulator